MTESPEAEPLRPPRVRLTDAEWDELKAQRTAEVERLRSYDGAMLVHVEGGSRPYHVGEPIGLQPHQAGTAATITDEDGVPLAAFHLPEAGGGDVELVHPGPPPLTFWVEDDTLWVRRALTPEAERRLRDEFALKRPVVRRAVKTSATAEGLASRLQGRLDAVARAQSLVAAAESLDSGMDLEHLIVNQALIYGVVPGERVRIDGPTFLLSAKTAGLFVPFLLALHELMATAAKYGALSVPEGRVDVSWRVEGASSGRRLRFEWREGWTPPVDGLPSRRGTGPIERLLVREFGGEESGTTASFEFGPASVRCTITLPLPPGVAHPPE